MKIKDYALKLQQGKIKEIKNRKRDEQILNFIFQFLGYSSFLFFSYILINEGLNYYVK